MIPLLILSNVLIVGTIVAGVRYGPKIREFKVDLHFGTPTQQPVYTTPSKSCQRCFVSFAVLHPYYTTLCHCCAIDSQIEDLPAVIEKNRKLKVMRALPEVSDETLAEVLARFNAMLEESANIGTIDGEEVEDD